MVSRWIESGGELVPVTLGVPCGWCWITVTSTGGDVLGGDKLGPKAETVRLWVRQAERDTGRRPGATTEELAELKRLKRENAELRRANHILPALEALLHRQRDDHPRLTDSPWQQPRQ